MTLTSICRYCTKPPRNVTKSIYYSKCNDIFTNLALEDWLYKNRDFSHHQLLMIWRNEPCVVIGRHQNPWLECNFAALPTMGKGVKLARRNSGGGTVYHDMENLNLTFFTSREEYSRKRNLELISRALHKYLFIHSYINKREDLCIDDCKISGTASKLGRTTAYHHCTLLVNANKEYLSLALKNILGKNVKTNASVSVRSKIKNLSEVKSDITVNEVVEAIIREYTNSDLNICKEAFGICKFNSEEQLPLFGVNIIESINEENFSGITDIKHMFLSDEWRFKRTPKFTIFRDLFDDGDAQANKDCTNSGTAYLEIEKGIVANIGIKSKNDNLSVKNNNLSELTDLLNVLINKSFSKEVLDEFELVVCGLRNSELCRTLVLNN